MNEFQAALGLCNLLYIDKEIIKRAKVVERYNERLTSTKGITLSLPQKGVKSNYAYYPVVFTGYRHNRDGIYEKLKADDIYSRKHFYPLASDYQCYKGRFDSSKIPVAQYITSRMLRLPLYADFALSDVDRICDLILGRR